MRINIINKGIPEKKLSILPNWVDTNFIKPISSSNLKAGFGLPEDSFVVLHAGNMGKKQGLEVILETAKLLSNHNHILFVLSGEGANRQKLEELAGKLTNVRFLPLQPLDNLNALLNMADIHILAQKKGAADLVMPSRLSGMLASGNPVIALANIDTEIASIVSRTGLVVPPENPDALAKAIIRLYNDSDLRKNMASKGRHWVESNWSKEFVLSRFSNELLQIHDEIKSNHEL